MGTNLMRRAGLLAVGTISVLSLSACASTGASGHDPSSKGITSCAPPLEAVTPTGSTMLGTCSSLLGYYPKEGLSLSVGQIVSLTQRVKGLRLGVPYSSRPGVLNLITNQGGRASFEAVSDGTSEILFRHAPCVQANASVCVATTIRVARGP